MPQEVKELLRDIEEVSKMAAEIAELVEARSEAIQSIVGNVDMANDYGETGSRLQPDGCFRPKTGAQARDVFLTARVPLAPPARPLCARSEAGRAVAREGPDQHAGSQAPDVLLRHHCGGAVAHRERCDRGRARRCLRRGASWGLSHGEGGGRPVPACI